MSEDQVARLSPLHSSGNGTVVNRRLRFPRTLMACRHGISISGASTTCLLSTVKKNERMIEPISRVMILWCACISTRITRTLHAMISCGACPNTRFVHAWISGGWLVAPRGEEVDGKLEERTCECQTTNYKLQRSQAGLEASYMGFRPRISPKIVISRTLNVLEWKSPPPLPSTSNVKNNTNYVDS